MKKIFILGDRETYKNYHSALNALGGVTINDESKISECDALLLTGGDDVNPSLYGEENAGSEGIDDNLDKKEFELIEHFTSLNKPILGICRGAQILNVFFGGSLIQHLNTSDKHSRCGGSVDKVHKVKTVGDSFLKKLYGDNFFTNSAHHQAINGIADVFTVSAISDDGVIEAAISEEKRIIALQWHPERMCLAHKREDTVDGLLIFKYFFDII